MSKCGQLIFDERPITHDAVTENAEATFTDPIITYLKALVTSDPVFRGRGHVQPHFFANPTVIFGAAALRFLEGGPN